MKALLVVGAARSGTTLLGNLLAASAGVSSLSHPLHWGQKESALGAMMLSFPDLDADVDYVRFIEQLLASDLCRIAGTRRDTLFRERLPDVASIYLRVMEDLCERQGRSVWLSKLDPLLLAYPTLLAQFRRRLRERGHGVTWACIDRDSVETVDSYLNMEGADSKWKLGWAASRMGIAVHLCRMAQIAHFVRALRADPAESVVSVTYDGLRAEPVAAVAPVLAAAGAPPLPAVPDALPRNRSPARTAVPLRAVERAAIRAAARLLASPPARPFADACVGWRERRRPRYEPFAYRLLLADRFPDRLIRRLEATGETELAGRVRRAREEAPKP